MRGRPKLEGELRSDVLQFRVRPSDLEYWKAQAEARALSLSAWLELVANAAAHRRPVFKINNVEARIIEGYPNYAVTRDGLVWGREDEDSDWQLRPLYGDVGYLSVTLPGKSVAVHRLVLEQFKGPPKEGQVCRHLDGSRDNNHVDNLAWGTLSENARDRYLHQEMRKSGELPPKPEYGKDIITFKASRASKERYARVAAAAGMTTSEWMRAICDAAAGLSPLPEDMKRKVEFEVNDPEGGSIRDGEW